MVGNAMLDEVPGIATSDQPRFPGEDLVTAVVAGAILAVLRALVYSAAGSGTEPPGRGRAGVPATTFSFQPASPLS